MMFPVKYVIPTSFGKVMTFFGEGTVHLLETAVILEGLLPRIRVPLLLTAYHQLLCGHTVRTVPYAMIADHRPPNILRWHHVLIFWMPAGSRLAKHAVRFRLEGGARDSELASLLRERVTVAKSLQGGPTS